MGDVGDLKSAIVAYEQQVGYLWKTGEFVRIDTHLIVQEPNRNRSDFVPCPASTSIKYVADANSDAAASISFYNVKKEWIAGYTNQGNGLTEQTITTPAGTAYCMLCGYKFSTPMDAMYVKYPITAVPSLIDRVNDAISTEVGTLNTTINNKTAELTSAVDTVNDEIYNATVIGTGNAVWGNDGHTRITIRLGQLNGALLKAVSTPSNIRLGISAFSDQGYTNKVYDSSWITSYPFTVEINHQYYYLLSHAKNDYGAFTSLSDIDGEVVELLSSRFDDIENNVDELIDDYDAIDNQLEQNYEIELRDPYYPNAETKQQIRVKLGRIYSGGKLIIKSLAPNQQISISSYTTGAYTTLVYNSGWKTEFPFEIEINTNHYYLLAFAKIGWGAFVSLDDIDGADIVRVTSTLEKLDNVSPLVSYTVRSIAHRGDRLIAPQNTAPAYIIARKRGFTIGENDVFISSDNEYVMWHDVNLALLGNLVDINGYEMYTDGTVFYYYDTENEKLYTYTTDYVESSVSLSGLTRCAGSSYSVEDLPLAVLKRIDFGVYKGDQFKGTQILTFAEWLVLMKGIGMDCYIDRKVGMTPEIATELATIVKRYGMQDHVSWLGVPYANLIEAIRAVDPNARIGVLEHPTAELIAQYTPYNTGRGFFFDGNASSMTLAATQLGIDAGFDVEVYYVSWLNATNAEIFETIKTAVSYGVSGLTLDHYRVDDAYQDLMDKYHT